MPEINSEAIFQKAEQRFRKSAKQWASSQRRYFARQILRTGFRTHVDKRIDSDAPHKFGFVLLPSLEPNKKARPLCIPEVSDFAAQCWMYEAIMASFDIVFPPHTYGVQYRDRNRVLLVRGAHNCVQDILTTQSQGYKYGFETDIKGFFPSIDRELMLNCVEKHLNSDWRRILEPVIQFEPKSKELLDTEEFSQYFAGKGVAQGGVLSPLLANLFLLDFDKVAANRASKFFRYVDDIVLLSRSAKDRNRDAKFLKSEFEKLKLVLHPDKTKDIEPNETYGFLGFKIGMNSCAPSDNACEKLVKRIKKHCEIGKSTPFSTLVKINDSCLGWYFYFGTLWSGPKSGVQMRTLQNLVNAELRPFLESRHCALSESQLKNFGAVQLTEYRRLSSFDTLKKRYLTNFQLSLFEFVEDGGSSSIEENWI